MKVFERRLVEDIVIVRGNPSNRACVIVNGDTYTIEFNGLSMDYYFSATFLKNKEVIADGRQAYIEFEKATGMSVDDFYKYTEKIKFSKFKPCCKKKAVWERGFPGEHLLICPVCNQVLDRLQFQEWQ